MVSQHRQMRRFALLWTAAAAWALTPPPVAAPQTALTRRSFGFCFVAGIVAPATAAQADVPSKVELAKLTQGYERLQELLTNWDAITLGACRGLVSAIEAEQIVATNGGASCDKAPLKVQEYVGYKSINDPLFKAEKLMLRAVPLLKDDVNVDDYLDNVNTWAEKAQMSSLNAYTSSWGEANPNGGKGQVAAFLDDARFDVEESAKVLKSILTMLDLPLSSKV